MIEVDSSSAQPDVNSVNSELEGPKAEDKVSYETYKKVLSEAKKAKLTNSEISKELDVLKQAELESKGQQAKLIENLRIQVAEQEKLAQGFKKDFAFQSFKNAVVVEGTKHGCLDYDLMMKAIDVSTIDINDDFTINQEDLTKAVSELVSKKPYLFKKAVPQIKDSIPGQVNSTNGKLDLNKLSLTEKLKMLAEMSSSGNFNKK